MRICFFLTLITCATFFSANAAAQSRDFLTDDEVEIIRDAQQIDQRIDVLIHAIDRRFSVLKVNMALPGKPETKAWGTLPQGTRLELLVDIKRILQKAIDDIDNISDRPDSMVLQPDEKDKKKPRGFADLFPKAVRSLAAAAERYKPVLKSELDKTKEQWEKGPILDSLDLCDQITASLAKLILDVAATPGKKH